MVASQATDTSSILVFRTKAKFIAVPRLRPEFDSRYPHRLDNIMVNNLDAQKYSLVPYDPHWPQRFEELRKMLMGVFGTKALHIEHVGSTAIPGMTAKPIIDVLVIVETMEDFAQEKQAMLDRDYICKADYIAPRTLLFFKVGADGEKVENIHVCEEHSSKVRQFLTMRDFFRSLPNKARAYSELKQINREKYPDDYPGYRTAKQSFLEQVRKEAYQWEDEGGAHTSKTS